MLSRALHVFSHPLWVGYIAGGTTMALMGALAAMADYPAWAAPIAWVVLTPFGIRLAARS